MIHSLAAVARAVAPSRPHVARRRRAIQVGIAVLSAGAVAAASSGPSTAAAAATCDRSATPSTFASEVSAATAGQTICLASGNYGTWSGVGKQIIIRAAEGAAPQMKVNLGSGDGGFTLDRITGLGGTINAGAHDLTIENSTFTSTIDIEGSITNVVLDHNAHNWNAVYDGSANAKIFLSTSGSSPGSALTIKNSTIQNGNLDGVHFGGGSGVLIQNNTFTGLCDTGTNHTDYIQFEGGTQIRLAGNFINGSTPCSDGVQGITSFDSGTVGVVIEDNVIDIHRPWGIEWYSDKNSTIRHNTVRYYAPSNCDFNATCGQIDVNRKSADPAGSGTQVYGNLATVGFSNGSTGTASNNVSSQQAVYVGPLGTYSGFKLASTSPIGLLSAGDGLDSGARISSSTTTSPSPTPTPTPTPTNTAAAAAAWKVPTGAVVGAPVTLDGTASGGDGPIACTWSIEDQAGSTVYETVTGCKVSKTFPTAGTKYVKLTVKDADGQTNSLKQSFNVSAVADTPATAVWSAPVGAKVGVAVTLDGSASRGDAQIACTWSFEDQAGGVVYETLTGCKLSKAFKFVGTKYVKLTVKDADGDTSSLKRSFKVS